MYQGKKIAVIIAAAGSGTRMGGGINKQFRQIGGLPVLAKAIKAFDSHPMIDAIYLVSKGDNLHFCRENILAPFGFGKVIALLEGGEHRQDSVYRGLLALSEDVDFVLIHDGARPFVSHSLITQTVETVCQKEAVAVAVPVKDTIKVKGQEGHFIQTPNRSSLYAVQTPQAFAVSLLKRAMETAYFENFYGTDDSVLVERLGQKVYFVKGENENIKITTAQDMEMAEAIWRRMEQQGRVEKNIGQDGGRGKRMQSGRGVYRTGTGFDVHQLIEGRKLILGGVGIPYERGLLGHSDADVLLHAVMDAMLGAAAMGDIGTHFPDSDEAYRDVSSMTLLHKVTEIISEQGYEVENLDVVIIAQAPKIASFIPEMKRNLSVGLGIDECKINIKGTTTEGLGFCGRGEGIAAQAAVMIYRYES